MTGNWSQENKDVIENVLEVLSTANFSSMCFNQPDSRLLEFYILATFQVISWQVPTYDSAHWWWLYSVAPLGGQATNPMSWYPTLSRYPDTEPTIPCPILIMPSAWLGSVKNKLLSHWFDSTRVPIRVFESPILPKRETDALLIRPSRLVSYIRVVWYTQL